jgi:hypothetical protein
MHRDPAQVRAELSGSHGVPQQEERKWLVHKFQGTFGA